MTPIGNWTRNPLPQETAPPRAPSVLCVKCNEDDLRCSKERCTIYCVQQLDGRRVCCEGGTTDPTLLTTTRIRPSVVTGTIYVREFHSSTGSILCLKWGPKEFGRSKRTDERTDPIFCNSENTLYIILCTDITNYMGGRGGIEKKLRIYFCVRLCYGKWSA